MSGVTIVGTGHHVPGDPVRNEALARVMDTSDDWIRARTGIQQRYFAEDGQGPSDLAVPACKSAIDDAGIDASEIDYIIFATMTPDHFFPGSGPLLGAKLGIPGVPALDIRQQCAAMPYALQLANGLVRSGAAKTILLVGAEVGDLVVHAVSLHAAIGRLQEAEGIDPRIGGEARDQTDVRSFRSLDGAHSSVMRIMNVPDLETCPFPAETTGAQCA